MNTVPEILWQKTNLENEWQATLDAAGDALKCKRPFSRDWLERRELESALITQFRRYRQEVASAAASAFDYVAIRWCQQREEGEHAPNSIDLKIHACERFVCFVYIDFLLAMLTRIRTLIVAIGGMYVLILIGTTLYPFEPRTGIQLLLFVLLASIIAAVGTVFAQMHRDTTLSHITDTHPGELGSDFWIRMGSFVALPLFTLFTSQFPSVNRLFYSWIRPAIESLNH
jgi:hypothetical protein